METEALNWTAILVGTIAAFFAGWAIYSPFMFGKTWALGSRISSEPPEQMPWMRWDYKSSVSSCWRW